MKIEPPTRILAVDTSSPLLTLALWKEGKLAGQKNIAAGKKGKGEAHFLPFYVSQLLEKAKVSLSEIEVMGYGFGPGSFTGLRVGLASLKACLLTQPKLKAVRFSSLDLIASGIEKSSFAVVIDARREKFYFNHYHRDRGECKRFAARPLLLSASQVASRLKKQALREPVWVAGDGLDRLSSEIKEIKNCHALKADFWYPKAKNAYGLVRHSMACEEWIGLSDVRPDYLRRSEAEEKWGLCYDERDLK